MLTFEIMSSRLSELESVIAKELASFLRVGNALMEIHEQRLYREAGYKSFNSYCQQKWGFTRDFAYKQISGAKVAKNILSSQNVDRGIHSTERENKILPTAEKQVRHLSKLEPEQQSIVWDKAVKLSGGEQPTERIVKEVVDEIVVQRIKTSPVNISTLISNLKGSQVKTATKAELKKLKTALAPIYPDPCEIGYENARLKAEVARLKQDVERYKPVAIDVNTLGSREVKGLAQRLELNQNLNTEETRELLRETLKDKDALLKARQLYEQTEVELLQAKLAEQQELLKLWEESHQYALGEGSFPWVVLGLRELEGIEYNRPRYRKLIEFWHPDRNKLPIAAEMTARINKAWTAYCSTFNKRG